MPDPNATNRAAPANPAGVSTPGTAVATPREDFAAVVARFAAASGDRPKPELPGFDELEELGRGGMGVVYKARQPALKRTVAVKMVLAGAHASPTDLARFQIEAEAVAALQHPHVVQLYEFGRHAGLPYFALEYVPGGTLADRIAGGGRFAPAASAALVAKLADAMAVAHARGIIHRDLKPGNVLLTEAGEPKITDFGLARLGGESQVTAPGAVMGTPAYMSPEQAAGDGERTGASADIYALGGILYALLTCRGPFQGDTPEESARLLDTRTPARPRALVPSVPADLETICLKCLRREASDRYSTAGDLAADLRAFLGGRPITARPVGPLERAWMWTRRNARPVTAVAAVTVLAVSGAVWADLRTGRAARRGEATELFEALGTADTREVPGIVKRLGAYHDIVAPQLREAADSPVSEKRGLHARIALLDGDDRCCGEVVAYAPDARPTELPTICGVLAPRAGEIAPALWAVAGNEAEPVPRRVRAACVLAAAAPGDPRWSVLARVVADGVARATPEEYAAWSEALLPVRHAVGPEVLALYARLRGRLAARTLDVSEATGEAAAFEQCADLVVRMSADRPPDLAEATTSFVNRHYPAVRPHVRRHAHRVAPLLRGEFAYAPADIAHAAEAALGPGITRTTAIADEAADGRAKRQAHAAATLLELGDPTETWRLLGTPSSDPAARSYLIARLPVTDRAPVVLGERALADLGPHELRAVVVALGDVSAAAVPEPLRRAVVARLVRLYESHPDSGLHSAIDWLLRRAWGMGDALDPTDAGHRAAGLARRSRPLADPAEGKGWYVDGFGHTYAVIRPPARVAMGSPPGEPERRHRNEVRHTLRIERTFAIAAREVTFADFLSAAPHHDWNQRYSRTPDDPVIALSFYQAAVYCNWLSREEGIPDGEWCYEPNGSGQYAEGMRLKPGYLALRGYRMPTEAEWEFAARAGAETARHYGRSAELLPRYAWSQLNSRNHLHPVGLLRPNDNGLFDALGNACEWTSDPGVPYDASRTVDDERPDYLALAPQKLFLNGRQELILVPRILRGGAFNQPPPTLRSADRLQALPQSRVDIYGLRPARSLPDPPPAQKPG